MLELVNWVKPVCSINFLTPEMYGNISFNSFFLQENPKKILLNDSGKNKNIYMQGCPEEFPSENMYVIHSMFIVSANK